MKKPNRPWVFACASAVLVAAIAVAVITVNSADTDTPTSAPSSSAPTGVAPTVSAVIPFTPLPANADIKAGEELAEDPGTLEEGLFSYALPDGSFVVVDADVDLPAEVMDALAGEGAGALGLPGGVSGGVNLLATALDPAARLTAYGQYSEYAHARTGKWVVLVAQGDEAGEWTFWSRDGDDSQQSLPATEEQTTSDANAWAEDHAGSVVVVVGA